MTAHAALGASNAHRWMECPGSVEAERGIDDKPSAFAEEGTRAHDLAERALTTGATVLDAHDDQEMAEFVRTYVEYVQHVTANADHVAIEQRVDYGGWVTGGFGTADAIAVVGDTLQVIDLKYGMGVRVDAANNPQGMLYALGAYAATELLFEVKRVVITIVQPRLDHISEWEISIGDLLRWAEFARQAAEATQQPDAPRHPGEKQCRFCKAKASCRALMEYAESVLMSDFDALDDLPKANTLRDHDMRRALDAKPLIEGWLSAVEAQVKERLETGRGFGGYKLVAGKSSRRWRNDDDAATLLAEHLGDDAFAPPKLLSPAQAEKALGKQRKGVIADLVEVSQGRPALAPETDKRPAINATADDFDDCAE